MNKALRYGVQGFAGIGIYVVLQAICSRFFLSYFVTLDLKRGTGYTDYQPHGSIVYDVFTDHPFASISFVPVTVYYWVPLSLLIIAQLIAYVLMRKLMAPETAKLIAKD